MSRTRTRGREPRPPGRLDTSPLNRNEGRPGTVGSGPSTGADPGLSEPHKPGTPNVRSRMSLLGPSTLSLGRSRPLLAVPPLSSARDVRLRSRFGRETRADFVNDVRFGTSSTPTLFAPVKPETKTTYNREEANRVSTPSVVHSTTQGPSSSFGDNLCIKPRVKGVDILSLIFGVKMERTPRNTVAHSIRCTFVKHTLDY